MDSLKFLSKELLSDIKRKAESMISKGHSRNSIVCPMFFNDTNTKTEKEIACLKVLTEYNAVIINSSGYHTLEYLSNI